MTRKASGEPPAPEGSLVPSETNDPSPSRGTRRAHSTRQPLKLRGALLVPPTMMKWERDVLLPFALDALTDFVETNEHATPPIEKKTK